MNKFHIDFMQYSHAINNNIKVGPYIRASTYIREKSVSEEWKSRDLDPLMAQTAD